MHSKILGIFTICIMAHSTSTLSSNIEQADLVGFELDKIVVVGNRQGCQVFPIDFDGDGVNEIYYKNISSECGGTDSDFVEFFPASDKSKIIFLGNRAGCSVDFIDLNGDKNLDIMYQKNTF